MQHDTVYAVISCRTSGDPFGAIGTEEFFNLADAEATRDRYNATDNYYARIEKRAYKPAEHKSNFSRTPVQWDMPITISNFVPLSEHHERYYS